MSIPSFYTFFLGLKYNIPRLVCSKVATLCSFVRKPRFVDVFFTASSRTLRLLSQGFFAALLQYLPIETFAAEFQLFRGFLVAAVNFTKKTELFRTPELLFQKTRFSLTADSGEEISHCISSETIGTFF